jgi:hypothetical protein
MDVPDDPRYGYHLELLRGCNFSLQRFKQVGYHYDHDHCAACGKKLAEFDWPETEHEGYLTKLPVPPAGENQLTWICRQCFADFREALDWSVMTEEICYAQLAAPPPKQRSHQAIAELDAQFPFARVGWAIEEVQGIADSFGVRLTSQDAEELLVKHERFIAGVMTHAGYQFIRHLIQSCSGKAPTIEAGPPQLGDENTRKA